MYTTDLAHECLVAKGPAVRAIGWLEKGRPYTIAGAEPRFLAALRQHALDPGRWLPFASAGVYVCDLGGCERAGGAQFVVIPSRSCVYVAPELVVHYVEHHRYSPPTEFVDAVVACPEQSSDAYVDLLLPFAGVWALDEQRVRRIAASRHELRRIRAEHDSATGGFRW